MKKRSLLTLLGLLPLIATAHTLPIPHSHHGVLNGWEGTAIMIVAVVIAVFLVRKVWKPLKG